MNNLNLTNPSTTLSTTTTTTDIIMYTISEQLNNNNKIININRYNDVQDEELREVIKTKDALQSLLEVIYVEIRLDYFRD